MLGFANLFSFVQLMEEVFYVVCIDLVIFTVPFNMFLGFYVVTWGYGILDNSGHSQPLHISGFPNLWDTLVPCLLPESLQNVPRDYK